MELFILIPTLYFVEKQYLLVCNGSSPSPNYSTVGCQFWETVISHRTSITLPLSNIDRDTFVGPIICGYTKYKLMFTGGL